jgi:hypothetical protein
MKYIVYCTTNLKNGKIYIGVHKTKTPNEFDGYIGCGVKVPTKVDKPFKVLKPYTPFHYAVNKYGHKNFYRVVLAIFDTESEAYTLESELVTEEFVKDKHSYNMIPGGNKPQAVTRQVIQYTGDGEFIKLWDSMSNAERELGVNVPDMIATCLEEQITAGGFVWRYTSDKDPKLKVTVRKRVPSNKGEVNAVPVVQYSKAGYRMRTFPSVAKAAAHLNSCAQNISASCVNYIKNKSAAGYQWRYESDNIDCLPPLERKRNYKKEQNISDELKVEDMI